jgi:hypothetical protein
MSDATATSALAPWAFVALHEAGHARVARALGVHVQGYHLSVEQVGEYVKVEGHISFEDPAANRFGIHAKYACRDMIAIAVAGDVAEQAWFGAEADKASDDDTIHDRRDSEAADYWIGRLERMESVSTQRRAEILRQQMIRAGDILRRDKAIVRRLALDACERIDRELRSTGTSASITVGGEELEALLSDRK